MLKPTRRGAPSVAAPPFLMPSLESVDPEYAALKERHAGLVERLQRVTRRMEELTLARPVDTTADAVAALVQGLPEPDAPTETRVDEYHRLAEQRPLIRAAIDELHSQVGLRRIAASRAAWKHMSDYHRSLVVKTCDALRALADASAELADFRDAVNDRGLSWADEVQFTPEAVVGYRCEAVNSLLNEAARAGYITSEAANG